MMIYYYDYFCTISHIEMGCNPDIPMWVESQETEPVAEPADEPEEEALWENTLLRVFFLGL